MKRVAAVMIILSLMGAALVGCKKENDNSAAKVEPGKLQEVYEAVKIPIIGMGGVSSAEDVCELMLAGASAVEVGAANLRDPFICKKIVEALPDLCARMGVSEIRELTGGAH